MEEHIRAARFEPDPLRIGKAFGRLVAAEYPKDMAQGNAQPEAPVTVTTGRRGRIDLLLKTQDRTRPLLIMVEVRSTDWNGPRRRTASSRTLRATPARCGDTSMPFCHAWTPANWPVCRPRWSTHAGHHIRAEPRPSSKPLSAKASPCWSTRNSRTAADPHSEQHAAGQSSKTYPRHGAHAPRAISHARGLSPIASAHGTAGHFIDADLPEWWGADFPTTARTMACSISE
jgi:hypothetical protein